MYGRPKTARDDHRFCTGSSGTSAVRNALVYSWRALRPKHTKGRSHAGFRHLLRGDARARFEAILHLAANGGDIAIVYEINVGVAHDLVLFDRSLQADIVRKPHRQCA